MLCGLNLWKHLENPNLNYYDDDVAVVVVVDDQCTAAVSLAVTASGLEIYRRTDLIDHRNVASN